MPSKHWCSSSRLQGLDDFRRFLKLRHSFPEVLILQDLPICRATLKIKEAYSFKVLIPTYQTTGDNRLHGYPENGGSIFLRNVGNYLPMYRGCNIPCVVFTYRSTRYHKTTIKMWNPWKAWISCKLTVDKLVKKFLRWPLVVKHSITNVAFVVLTAVTMGSIIFWDVTPYSLVHHGHLKEMHCLHLQCRRVSKARNRTPLAAWLTLKMRMEASFYQTIRRHIPGDITLYGSAQYCKMAVRLSDLCAGRPLNRRRFLVLISVTGLVEPRAIVRLEGLNPMISSGLEPTTFRFVA
jgi:hypothetical protein